MRKTAARFVVLFAMLVVAVSMFADYTVVMKDGTRYQAKAKWTIVDGKARIQLKTGQTLQVDPALIDAAKSDQITKLGVNANIVDLSTNMPANQPNTRQQPRSLGDQIKLRPRTTTPAPTTSAPATAPNTPPPASTGSGSLPPRVIENFEKAFDNVGIYENKVNSTGARSLRAELTVDTEERVFMALSAASYLMVKNAGVDGVQIDMVELFMQTTTGGAAGRFQMSRADAEALEARQVTQQDYFIRKVIY